MADMPGANHRRNRVLWSSLLLCDDPINLTGSDVRFGTQVAHPSADRLVARATKHHSLASDSPPDLLLEIERVKVLLRC